MYLIATKSQTLNKFHRHGLRQFHMTIWALFLMSQGNFDVSRLPPVSVFPYYSPRLFVSSFLHCACGSG